MKLNRSTKLELVGHGTIVVAPADYLAGGGEGSVYRKAGTAIKLFTDPAKMRREQFDQKLRLLTKLSHPYVVAPLGIVNDQSGQPLGYYMDFAPGEPVCRLFTNDFRQRSGYDTPNVRELSSRMLEVVDYAHSRGAVMADANEFNWLMARGNQPRILDVDSWAIDRWPARAIMPSVRDWQTHGITAASDYFAWGIVTFQLFTGLHPYKGTLAGYKPSELERRMKDQQSVFASGVRLNRAVRDLNCIPPQLRDWYEATFQHGLRTPPPSPLLLTPGTASATVRTARMVVSATGTLKYARLLDNTDPAVRVFACGVVLLRSGRLYDLGGQRYLGQTNWTDPEVIQTDNGWLVAAVSDQTVRASFIRRGSFTATALDLSVPATQLVRSENRLFAVTGRGLTELRLMEFSQPVLTTGQTWGALPHSTRWFNGCGIQDTLGATHLILPTGDRGCVHIRTPQLDGLRPVNATAGHRFAAVIAVNRAGEYRRLQFSFDHNYQRYELWQGTNEGPELNLTVLPRGVAATIVRDGQLVVIAPSSHSLNRVADHEISTTMTLATHGEKLVYIQDGAVWSVRM